MPIVNLTADFLAHGLVCPEGKRRIEYCDRDCPGLLLEVRSASDSIPTWYVRYKQPTTHYQHLGNVRDMTLGQARTAARTFKATRASGAPIKGEITLEAFVTQQVNPYNAVHKRSHWRDLQIYRRIAPHFGHLKLKDIHRRDVQQFHVNLMEKEGLSPATADHHLVYLRRVLNLAIEWEYLDTNPLSKIQLMHADNKVERYLSEDETARLVHVLLSDLASGQSYIFLFLLNTGARRNEAVQAKWEQIDLERRIWTIPAANSKSKKGRTVPLNDGALWVLDHVATRDVHPYLFVNPISNKPFVTVTRAWYRLRHRAGLDDVRIHDLRHSFASRLVNGGRSLYEVQQILGHSTPKVTMRYAHLSNKSLQEAANVGSVTMH